MQVEAVAAKRTACKVIAQVAAYKKRIVAAGLCRNCQEFRGTERADKTRCSKCAKRERDYAKTRVLNSDIRERINKQQRARWHSNKAHCQSQAKRWRLKIQDKVYAAYGGYLCQCC